LRRCPLGGVRPALANGSSKPQSDPTDFQPACCGGKSG
jgi:hypothetical protein